MTDADKVALQANKLTEAQRQLLTAATETVDGRVLLDAYPPHHLNAHMVFMYSMARDRLTPLGFAVRTHILKASS